MVVLLKLFTLQAENIHEVFLFFGDGEEYRVSSIMRINEFLEKFEVKSWKFFISWFVYTFCRFSEWDAKFCINENYLSEAM